jgi:hypothetical protein
MSELAADTYVLLSRTFVHTTLTFSSTLLSFMRAHVVSLARGLVVGAAVIDSGLTFDTHLFAPDFSYPTTTRPTASRKNEIHSQQGKTHSQQGKIKSEN